MVALVWAVVTAFLALYGGADSAPQSVHPSTPDRLVCGPNSLYCALRLAGYDVDYSQILVSLPPTHRGHSLTSLRDTAAAFQVPLEIAHVHLDELERCPLPCIAYVPNRDPQDPREIGHFLVVTAVAEGRIYTLDGTSGASYRFHREQFSRRWEGVILRFSPDPSEKVLAGGLLLLNGIILGMVMPWKGFRTWCGTRSTVAVIAGLAVAIWPGLVSGDEPDVAEAWRIGDGDACLAVYLTGRLVGGSRDYETFRAAWKRNHSDRRVTVAELCEELGRLGLRSVPVQLTPDELRRLPPPVIVHLDGLQSMRSRYAIVLGYQASGGWELLECSNAMYVTAPEDEFRRAWTGAAIVLRPQAVRWGWVAGGLGLYILGRSSWRRWVTPPRLTVAVLLTGVILIGRSATGEEVLPEAVRSALEKNAHDLSPLQVQWVLKVSSPLSADELKSRGWGTEGYQYSAEVHYRYQPSRMHVLERTFLTDFRNPAQKIGASELAFDGENVYSGSGKMSELLEGRVPAPVLSIEPLKKIPAERQAHFLFHPAFLYAAGYSFPERYRELGRNPSSRVLDLLKSSSDSAQVGWVRSDPSLWRFTLSVSDRSYEFRLREDLGYAVEQWLERDAQNQLLRQGVNSEFAVLQDRDVLLPRRSRVTWYYWPDEPEQGTGEEVLVQEFELVSSATALAGDEAFVLNYNEPGSVIADSRPPEAATLPDQRIQYVVPAKGQDLDRIIAAAKRGEDPYRLAPRSRSSLVRWLIAVNIVLIGFLIVVAWLRRRKT